MQQGQIRPGPAIAKWELLPEKLMSQTKNTGADRAPGVSQPHTPEAGSALWRGLQALSRNTKIDKLPLGDSSQTLGNEHMKRP